jgi:hypothetical protein
MADDLAEAGPPDRASAATTFEQAKNPPQAPRFLQIVAKKPKRASARNRPEKKPEQKLTRVAFKVSRLMEFCTERELQTQTGHSVHDWLLVVAKELMDNALDACEEAEVAPEISIDVYRDADNDMVVIEDNAGGIDTETIKSVLNYAIRVSSREAYVSPTRGAQGNALKTILAMGYVLDRKIGGDGLGVTVIESRGVRHRIEFRVDHVLNQPKIIHTTRPSPVTVGTKIVVRWPRTNLVTDIDDEFEELVEAYAWFNTHSLCAGLGSGASSSTSTRPIRPGRSGGRVTRLAPIGMARRICSAIWPPMSRAIAT